MPRIGARKQVCIGEGGGLIARDALVEPERLESGGGGAGMALLFPAGGRASADAVAQLLAKPDAAAPARISSHRGQTEGWLELLSSGLTFDLAGLADAPAEPLAEPRHFFGLPRDAGSFAFECAVLRPGPHLSGAGAMVPVVRGMAALASRLARGLGALAVCWQPAGSWMDVQYFARIVDGWITGGAFPALGLTGIERKADGAVESDGLAWFVGQELRVEPRCGETAADTVKLAVRMIDHLVREGPVTARATLLGPDGETLLAEPRADGRFVRLSRDG